MAVVAPLFALAVVSLAVVQGGGGYGIAGGTRHPVAAGDVLHIPAPPTATSCRRAGT